MTQPAFTAEVYQNQYLAAGGQVVDAVITVTVGRRRWRRLHDQRRPGHHGRLLRVDVDAGRPRSRPRRWPATAAIDTLRDGVEFAIISGTATAHMVYPDVPALRVASAADPSRGEGRGGPARRQRRHRHRHLAATWRGPSSQRSQSRGQTRDPADRRPGPARDPRAAAGLPAPLRGPVRLRQPRHRQRLGRRRVAPGRLDAARHGRRPGEPERSAGRVRGDDRRRDGQVGRRCGAARVGAGRVPDPVRQAGVPAGRRPDITGVDEGQRADHRLSRPAPGATRAATTTFRSRCRPAPSARRCSPPASAWSAGDTVLAQSLVLATWTDDTALSTQINRARRALHRPGRTRQRDPGGPGRTRRRRHRDRDGQARAGRAAGRRVRPHRHREAARQGRRRGRREAPAPSG